MNSRSLSVLLSPYLAATGATSVSEIKMSEKTRTMLPQSTGVMVVTFTTWLSFSTTVLSSEGGSCVALPNVELTKFWIRSTTSAALSEEQQRANLKFPVSPRRVLFGKTKNDRYVIAPLTVGDSDIFKFWNGLNWIAICHDRLGPAGCVIFKV